MSCMTILFKFFFACKSPEYKKRLSTWWLQTAIFLPQGFIWVRMSQQTHFITTKGILRRWNVALYTDVIRHWAWRFMGVLWVTMACFMCLLSVCYSNFHAMSTSSCSVHGSLLFCFHAHVIATCIVHRIQIRAHNMQVDSLKYLCEVFVVFFVVRHIHCKPFVTFSFLLPCKYLLMCSVQNTLFHILWVKKKEKKKTGQNKVTLRVWQGFSLACSVSVA